MSREKFREANRSVSPKGLIAWIAADNFLSAQLTMHVRRG
jgi:hypothetical protein